MGTAKFLALGRAFWLDVGEKMRLWTYGCKPEELPRAILSGFVLLAVPSKRPQ
jgi:hypothetical protein